MPVHEQEVLVVNRLGLHARASAKLVETLSAYSARVRIGRGERLVDARSIMALLLMGAGKGSRLRIQAEGADAEAALTAVMDLFARRFDEPD